MPCQETKTRHLCHYQATCRRCWARYTRVTASGSFPCCTTFDERCGAGRKFEQQRWWRGFFSDTSMWGFSSHCWFIDNMFHCWFQHVSIDCVVMSCDFSCCCFWFPRQPSDPKKTRLCLPEAQGSFGRGFSTSSYSDLRSSTERSSRTLQVGSQQ